MRRFRLGLLLAVFVLSGCDHHKKVDQAQAEAGSAAVTQTDSAYTGEPPSAVPSSYRRALPVTLPTPTPAPGTTPTPATVAPAPLPESSPTPAPITTPPETASASASSPVTNPPPSSPSPEMTRLEMIPPTPSVATNPPRPMDDVEAQKQVVVLETSLGNIVIELDDVSAPRTCGNFRKLVSGGFYNHTTFHRVIPNFMIQGGDPNSKSDDRATYGQGDPGYTLPEEIKLKHVAGAVAMARLPDSVNPQRDSNGSQFFICVSDCPSLDDQYTVFGHVIQGMDTAIKIANQPRDQHDDPVARIEMEASLESKRQALEENSSGH